jgi:hypothetical protein
MSEVRKGTSRNTENENKRNFNTLSLVDCYIQICSNIMVHSWNMGVCWIVLVFVTELTVVRVVFTVFRLLTDFVCLYNYEFGLSLCKIVRSSVILLLPLFNITCSNESQYTCFIVGYRRRWHFGCKLWWFNFICSKFNKLYNYNINILHYKTTGLWNNFNN